MTPRRSGRKEGTGVPGEVRQPYEAAARGFIDEVVRPSETRIKLIHALRMLENKVDKLPHGRSTATSRCEPFRPTFPAWLGAAGALWMAGQLDSLLGVLPLTSGEERIRTLGEISLAAGLFGSGAALVHAREADSLARGLSDPALEAQPPTTWPSRSTGSARVREAIVTTGGPSHCARHRRQCRSRPAPNWGRRTTNWCSSIPRSISTCAPCGSSVTPGQPPRWTDPGNLSRVYELLGEIGSPTRWPARPFLSPPGAGLSQGHGAGPMVEPAAETAALRGGRGARRNGHGAFSQDRCAANWHWRTTWA